MNRIRELRKAYDIKQGDLAAAINVSQAALSGYETGRYEADIDTYRKISAYFRVSLDYLLGGSSTDHSAPVRIPVLGRIPAGIPIEAIEEILDWEELPPSMTAGGREYFALQVQGDSMYPDYLPGDIIIVRRTPDFNSGDDCVLYVNGFDATLKQVRRQGDDLVLVPRNSNYPPRTFSAQEVRDLPVTIAGVVVELRRKVKK